MLLGKPTIAVGRRWAADFITDGVNGLVVDYEDPYGLRRAIEWVLNNPAAAREMAERGREHAARFTTQRTMQTVYELVKGAAKPAGAVRLAPDPSFPPRSASLHVNASGNPT
jgi:glycosyltransferase involved in cell wall biosynthesis